MLENVFADDPAENFPFHWDGQEFVVTMNNGDKVIMLSKVPLRELADVYVFAQKPNGKLRRRSSSSRIDDLDGWPLHLDWKCRHISLSPSASDCRFPFGACHSTPICLDKRTRDSILERLQICLRRGWSVGKEPASVWDLCGCGAVWSSQAMKVQRNTCARSLDFFRQFDFGENGIWSAAGIVAS